MQRLNERLKPLFQIKPFTVIKLIVLLILVIYIVACGKKDAASDAEKILPPMKITAFGGVKWKGDSCGTAAPFHGFWLSNNRFVIQGVNFGEVGNVYISDADVEIEGVNWTNNEVQILTRCDTLKEPAPVTFTIEREDDSQVSTTEKVITDIGGHAYKSQLGHILLFYLTKRNSIPQDFSQDFQDCNADYIPEPGDLVLMPNGEFRLVNSLAGSTANGTARTTYFYTDRWDCDGVKKLDYNVFSSNSATGEVKKAVNSPVKFLQF